MGSSPTGVVSIFGFDDYASVHMVALTGLSQVLALMAEWLRR